jgi:hypothetical protein
MLGEAQFWMKIVVIKPEKAGQLPWKAMWL